MQHLNKKLLLIVFVTGACIMMLEVTGSRILAPYFGTSIIVWTSLIGLILGSLSIGYWWGGKLADAHPSIAMMSILILWAAACVGVLALLKGVVTAGVSMAIDDIRVGTVLVVLFLFCPPSVLLAMASPFAARLAIHSAGTSGETIGKLYALSTLGSIVGTFLAGFVLLAIIGHTAVLLLIATALLAVGMLGLYGLWTKKRVLLCVCVTALILCGIFRATLFPPAVGLVADIDTSYQRIQVRDDIDAATQRPVRLLQTDSFGVQSAKFTDTDDPQQVVFLYTRFYRLVEHFTQQPQRALMIGGAAYSVPRDLLARHPQLSMDVVELDPGMTRVARDFFDLRDDSRLAIHHIDGRLFLHRANDASYDAIFIDAFQSVVLPFQLTTREAVQEMYRALDDDGVVIVNTISAIDGLNGRIIQAEVATYRSIFPHVAIYPIRYPDNPDLVQNVMLIASKQQNPSQKNNDPELQSYLDAAWTQPIQPGRILTDDFAPIENYIFGLIR